MVERGLLDAVVAPPATLSALFFESREGWGFDFEATFKPLQLANVPIAIAHATAFTSRDFIQVRQGILISKKTKQQLGGSL